MSSGDAPTNPVTITTVGYTVHAADGRMLAYVEHIEQALGVMRADDGAEVVRRVIDNEVMATKLRAVRRTRVGERQPFTLKRLGVAS